MNGAHLNQKTAYILVQGLRLGQGRIGAVQKALILLHVTQLKFKTTKVLHALLNESTQHWPAHLHHIQSCLAIYLKKIKPQPFILGNLLCTWYMVTSSVNGFTAEELNQNKSTILCVRLWRLGLQPHRPRDVNSSGKGEVDPLAQRK